MKLREIYLRWRHSKGYGVHSPYAFRFINDVVRPGNYGYYAYDNLEQYSRGESIESRWFFKDARFIIRLSVFLKTKRIVTLGKRIGEARIAAKALKITYYNCESPESLTPKPGDLLIIFTGREEYREVIHRAIEKDVAIYAVSPCREIEEVIEKPIEHGVLFEGKTKLILIPRKEMEYVSYSVKF